jgi:hypothetical protein
MEERSPLAFVWLWGRNLPPSIKLLPPPQMFAEKRSVCYPTEMYESYTAYEAEGVELERYRSKHIIQNMRKGRTFFFRGLIAYKSFPALFADVVLYDWRLV